MNILNKKVKKEEVKQELVDIPVNALIDERTKASKVIFVRPIDLLKDQKRSLASIDAIVNEVTIYYNEHYVTIETAKSDVVLVPMSNVIYICV